MANLVRPPLRSSTEQRRTRHTKSVAADDVENTAQHHHPSTRSSKSTHLLTLGDENHPRATNAPPTRPTRANRKRSAGELVADAKARPPTKVTVTQPHGELLSITNGVQQPLGIGADEVPSGVSTPKPNGAGLIVPVPQIAGTQAQDKRSLRSQDGGSRLKSDLAIYFSNYDDIIAGVPKPPELLDLETPIYIVDEPLKTTPHEPSSPEASRTLASPTRSRKSRANSSPRKASTTSIPSSQSSTTFQVLDYSSITRHLRNDSNDDPLADSVFFTQHRRAERKEKQLRNIEKERAMHEKVQLERLLDGLQGPDWLKVMGITGVTDGERKDWEPKRDYFVKEVEALVDKFRIWKEEEKRLRAQKEAALAAQEEEEDEELEFEGAGIPKTNGKAPSASEQRHKEPEPPKPRRPPRPQGFLLPIIAPEPTTPFNSFYAKPHLRTAALGKHRHGRNATAFGLPIPDFEEHDFSPPDEWMTPEFLRDLARKRRREKRESGVNPKSN